MSLTRFQSLTRHAHSHAGIHLPTGGKDTQSTEAMQLARPPASPEQWLAASVIEHAISDIRLGEPYASSAARWFLATGDASYGSFRFWCQVANVDADAIRDRLTKRYRLRRLARQSPDYRRKRA